MPVNRNALIRYRTIDQCLRNRYRQWTLEDLIEACSEALYEYEGIDKGVSRRTVQGDIQMMRSDKLGYNAPITVIDKKYYAYEDPEYSITNIPLTDQDLNKLTEVVEILRQFEGFSHFQELNGMVKRLEDKVQSAKYKQAPVIDFEKNPNLKGLEHLDTLYQAVLRKQPLTISYQSFRAKAPRAFTFHPYLLKEFRNRWFLLGRRNSQNMLSLLALDRMEAISHAAEAFIPEEEANISNYFDDVIGVTVSSGGPIMEVRLWVDAYNSPYVRTKPIHPSQEIVQENADGSIEVIIRVKQNFELMREIMGFGPSMVVLEPRRLRDIIKKKVAQSLHLYQL